MTKSVFCVKMLSNSVSNPGLICGSGSRQKFAGGGAITGAIIAGPVGALTGGLIGAGVVTAHLLINHPQATLEPGTVLIFSLSEPLLMTSEGTSGN